MNTTQTGDVPTLAQRCFDAGQSESDLFDTLHKIMGGRPYDEYKAGFLFPVADTWVDPYDSSVEIVMDLDASAMTREQADAVLALGFSRIYESQGTSARLWTATSVGPCSVRQSGDSGAKIIASLRIKLDEARRQLSELTQLHINIIEERDEARRQRDVLAANLDRNIAMRPQALASLNLNQNEA